MSVLFVFKFYNNCFCNSLANSWFDIFPFLMPPLLADLSRVVKVSDRAGEAGFLTKNL